MAVIRLTLAYDGGGFRGWADQRGQRTVEGVLSDALERVLGSPPELAVAGRTDAGVHARGQVASFVAPPEPDPARLRRALNAMLGPELVVLDARVAPPRFDARFSATAREYRYRIDVGECPDPFTARFVWHRPGSPSLPAMRAAGRHLLGERDFAAFCRMPRDGSTTMRRVERVSVSRTADRVEIAVRANAFLHQMVRSIVGTLVLVGDGALDPAEIPDVLASRDRSRAGQIAPPHGLTLERVRYGRR
ncbi:MAG: tRNA pseudouridine(38-40) synthase TruA [Actinomycetota bacterium]